ncbi:hypothetical protein TEA_001516 [Camellia sinensis var. sinensis]|uniref:Uncharacterized protein n=1 Tax=Camellia sinensis var. sinensis TaxID=542762 RepID=A0A4S4E8B8_CAMSN|nr:hypothetical protein TEA_001516 [Camellia sinensis var. sinensis]
MKLIAVGNQCGNVGFWDFDAENEDGDGIYLYRPHSAPVFGIAIQPFSIFKVGGNHIRVDRACPPRKKLKGDNAPLYDNKRMVFVGNLPFDVKVNCSSFSSYSLSRSGYFAECRLPICFSCCKMTCLFHDKSADVRKADEVCIGEIFRVYGLDASKFASYSLLTQNGQQDTVVIFAGGAALDLQASGRIFLAIWGWDDSYLFINNVKRGVDVISTARKGRVATLQSPNLSAVLHCFDAQPYQIGMFARATNGGWVYTWITT